MAMPSDRPELSSMAVDYAQNALSQRAAFEATHPAAMAAAREFADEPVLRVVDLGAADGVNSHGLIRALAEERAGRQLLYALVDLPTNEWGVATGHLQRPSARRPMEPMSSFSRRTAGSTTARRRITARPAAWRRRRARPPRS
jgi:hypothetical protein